MHLLGSALHIELSAKDDQHIGATIVEHPRPVVDHPGPRVLMDELILEVEHVRVIWRYFDIHFRGGLALESGALFYLILQTKRCRLVVEQG